MIKSHGFTLLELLVIIAIISTLAVTAVPFMTDWIAREDYRNSSQQILHVLQQGRSHAITRNLDVIVEFDLAEDDTYAYRLREREIDRTTGNPTITDISTWEDTDIPISVTLRGTAACDSSVDVTFNFNPNGSTDTSNQYICIFDSKNIAAGRKYRVGIANANSGRVTIEQ